MSDDDVEAGLQKKIGEVWHPLSFGERWKKFSPTQNRSTAFDRELSEIYVSITYFRLMIEGTYFVIITDPSPFFNKK